ncbi:MAG TPA: hypothetical protein VMS77_10085 [Conexivisphaerales archaeon]|nr:hypothetical protein [Conexivisphaerales archaeon]
MKRFVEDDDRGYYTFEWICRDPACSGENQLHRKRIRANSLEKAWLVAKAMSIPDCARVVEEEERKLKMTIAW